MCTPAHHTIPQNHASAACPQAPTDADYERALRGVAELDVRASAHGQPFVYVLVVDPSMQLPPAVWRKRFAAANQNVKSGRFLFAIVTQSVTQSAMMHGVYTAVTWLTGTPAGHSYTAVATLEDAEDAQSWLESQSGRPNPLQALEHKALQSLQLT